MGEEKTVTFLGTPLQFLAVIGGMVMRDGMGDPVTLPPSLDDIEVEHVYLSNVPAVRWSPAGKVAIDWRLPAEPDPHCQRISLKRAFQDEWGYRETLNTAVTVTGMGADKSIVSIPCGIERHWAVMEDGWNWLVSQLAKMGRIEGDAPEVQPAGSAPEVQPAGDEAARDDGAFRVNARKAGRQQKVREYRQLGMTIKDMAQSLYAGESTIKADLKELGLSKPRPKT